MAVHFVDWFTDPELPIGGFQAELELAEYVVIGLPFDETASFREGCADAPDAIRYYANNIEPINVFTGRDIAESMICDLGNLTFNRREDLFSKVQSILQQTHDKTPVLLGGEHTITAAVTERYKNHLFIMLDAHADLRDSYNGRWSHACTARRVIDSIGAGSMIQFGIRAISREELEFAKEMKISQYFAHEWSPKTEKELLLEVNERIESYDGIYLTLDMDGFDPAYVPGVGNPEPLGLSTREVFSILSKLPKIDGFDITELNPSFDPSGTSQSVAARLALFLMSR
ncbi:MAG: agmatinase [Methanobacteriota archaeon]|nr:MAG: agmatinase [Euryarchaeota archaeon]